MPWALRACLALRVADALVHATHPSDAQAALPPEIVDQAIDWAVRLLFNAPTADTRERFRRWEQADPRHRLAWQRVQSLQQDFPSMPAALALETLDHVEASRGRRQAARRQALKVLAFGGVSLLGVAMAHRYAPWQRWVAQASTGVGERRDMTLGDGTVVVLNTDTAIDIAFDATRRDIVLRRGEILITTGHDGAGRPFHVQTPFGAFQALGTRFVVRLGRDSARVAVQQGAVAVHAEQGNARDIARPGETWSMTKTSSAIVPPSAISPDGWANGSISGSHMRLADVLGELERYRHGRIDCDPRIANLTLSGAYRVDDTDRTLRFLEKSLPVRVSYLTRYWVRVGSKDGA